MGLYRDLGKKVAKAEASTGGVYWEPGKYLVLLDVVKVKEGRKSDFFIVEGDNLESDNPERPAGKRCSWVIDANKDAAPGNIKAFLAAALACSPDDINEDDFEDCVDEDNPLCGKLVRLQVTMTTTKSGNDFSKHNWQPVDQDLYKELKSLKRKAGL